MKRLQFRLQTVLLLTMWIATAFAWWSDHRELTERLREARARIQFLETWQKVDSPNLVAPLRIP